MTAFPRQIQVRISLMFMPLLHGKPLDLWFASIEGEYIMIAKIVPNHGTGSAASAIIYVSGDTDHKGNKRDEVVHLFGDGQQIIDLTESMTCEHTYLSSVLSFTKEESARLNVDDIRKLVAEFAEHHADPMGINAIAGCAYLHIEGGRYDAHLIQAQLDMESGKRVDLYLDMCGDTERIADWQDCKNYELKLDDPRDPTRMRLTNDKVREAKGREELRAWVNNHLLNKTINDEINSRADVITELESLGFEIKRQIDKSISIKSPDLSQNIRLTGGIYHESFRGIEGIREAIEAGPRRSEEDYRNQYETTRSRLAASNEKRTERISKKLKIDLKAREGRLQPIDIQNATHDLDTIMHGLRDASRSRNLGDPKGQSTHADRHNEGLSYPIISGQSVRHCAKLKHSIRPKRKYLDQTQIEGINHDYINHKIPSYYTHVPRNDDHAETMRAISACSQAIERASLQFDRAGESNRTTFERARKSAHAAIESITDYVGTVTLKFKTMLHLQREESNVSFDGMDA